VAPDGNSINSSSEGSVSGVGSQADPEGVDAADEVLQLLQEHFMAHTRYQGGRREEKQ
jgi:hypothetical protein